jgi:hypothetical protein
MDLCLPEAMSSKARFCALERWEDRPRPFFDFCIPDTVPSPVPSELGIKMLRFLRLNLTAESSEPDKEGFSEEEAGGERVAGGGKGWGRMEEGVEREEGKGGSKGERGRERGGFAERGGGGPILKNEKSE